MAIDPGSDCATPEEGTPPDDDVPPSPRPGRGKIRSVTGRRAQGGGPGFPALDRIALELPDGTTQDFGPPGQSESQGTLQFLTEIGKNDFQQDGRACCPICIDGDPTDREHVPSKGLGGSVMTTTCKACNSGLGSRVEATLQDWFDNAYRRTSLMHDCDVRGHRYLPTMYHRQVPDGAFLFMIDGETSPDVAKMLAGGPADLTFTPPDPRRAGLALLKHAYLAACLQLKSVPDTPEVHAIRADLLAARDTPRKAQPPESTAANQLKVYRSDVGKQGPPLALVAMHDPNGEVEPETLISLAGVLFVSWPFRDLNPVTWRRMDTLGD